MEEEWRDILGYEGLYQVSNLGRVKNNKNKIMKHHMNEKGYYRITLCKYGKRKSHLIHRLVAEAFIPNRCNLSEVNHIDENKGNNQVENLEWCTHKYNSNYGTRNKRMGKSMEGKYLGNKSSTSKRVMCVNTNEVFGSIREAGRKYNISNGDISKCCKGKLKSAGKHPITGEKLIWKYV